MTTKRADQLPRRLASYFLLVQEHPLVSIRSETQFNAAQKAIDRLLGKGRLDLGEQMYLDALSDLVATYEDAHYAIEPASDADMLRHLMEAKGVTQIQVHRDTAIPKSTVSEILSGKKTFTRSIIRTLAKYFDVSTTVLAGNL